jgi:predicted solute-binding protein
MKSMNILLSRFKEKDKSIKINNTSYLVSVYSKENKKNAINRVDIKKDNIPEYYWNNRFIFKCEIAEELKGFYYIEQYEILKKFEFKVLSK